MPKIKRILIFSCFTLSIFAFAQDKNDVIRTEDIKTDSSIFAQDSLVDLNVFFDDLEAAMATSSLFSLVDSLLIATQNLITNDIIIRLTYNSNVLTAGRSYGIKQHGLSSGVSFYHKKGFYSDLSTFWASAYDPNFNLTVGSLGYLKSIGNHISLSGGYEYYAYRYNETINEDEKYPSQGIGGSATFTYKFLSLMGDYTYLFGKDQAHRAITTLSGFLLFKGFGIIDHISLFPSFGMTYGNENITIRIDPTQKEPFRFQQLVEEKEFSTLHMIQVRRILTELRNGVITRQQARNRLQQIIANYPSLIEKYNQDLNIFDQKNQYGIMNYFLSIPITLSIDKWTLSIGYTYSLPVTLPGEIYSAEPTGFLTGGLSRRISLPNKK